MVPGLMRPTSRAVLRSAKPATRLWQPARTRFVSTQPPHLRSRSWKSSALRWGIAAAGIYYYNTSPVFAEQPQHNLLNPNVEHVDESTETSVLDELIARRSREAEKNREALAAEASTAPGPEAQDGDVQGAAELEAEAQGEGAFNPETGEINWDCPCLGGMAHGPCGPEFREAFSCFIYSQEEPKGMECIDKFQGMRDCFQQHPEVYKDELMEDEELDAELEAEKQELVGQIAERRSADEVAASSGHRLLEEPAPAAKANKSGPKNDSASSAKTAPPKDDSAPPAKTSTSQWPTPASSEATADSSASSPSQPRPEASATTGTRDRPASAHKSEVSTATSEDAGAVANEGVELVPKAAHDARDAGRTAR